MNDVPQPVTTPTPGSVSPGEWPAFVTAVQFLTRWPLSSAPAPADALRRSPVYFPLVGGLIGLTTAGTIWLGSCVWPVWLAVLAALALEAWMTGALHEDAVADFCDAFGGGWTRERTLEILKDSRIGTYGVLGLAFAVALRAGATIALVESDASVLTWAPATIAASALGRWAMVLAMATVAPVPNRDGLARDVGRQVSRNDLLAASLWGLPAVVFFVWQQPWHAVLAGGVLVFFVWRFLFCVQARLGGTTGDCLGCVGYLSQVLVLLVAAARFALGGGA